eukprot:scaffold159986_cov49-Attheya_sp.AAC.1
MDRRLEKKVLAYPTFSYHRSFSQNRNNLIRRNLVRNNELRNGNDASLILDGMHVAFNICFIRSHGATGRITCSPFSTNDGRHWKGRG